VVGTTPNYRWVWALNHKNNFDLLRLVAALQVAVMHSCWLGFQYPDAMMRVLWIFPGVPIFFVISGYLIAASLDSDSSPRYFLRRALRIYPALWVNLAVVALMMLCAGVMTASKWSNYLEHFAWLAFTGWSITSPLPYAYNDNLTFFPNGVLWTICVELGFYALAFVLFSKPIRNSRTLLFWAILGSIVVSLACQVWAQTSPPVPNFQFTTLPCLWIFLIGSSIYFARRIIAPFIEGKGLFWLAAYLTLSLYISLHTGEGPDYQNITPRIVAQVTLLAVTIVSLAFTSRGAARALSNNDLSYGLYLYHMPVVMALRWAGATGNSWLVLLVLSITTPIAWLSWRFVERPALALKSRINSVSDRAHERVDGPGSDQNDASCGRAA
jgi:peptidoglycan/LPS O-acetylase OafA/YrhL